MKLELEIKLKEVLKEIVAEDGIDGLSESQNVILRIYETNHHNEGVALTGVGELKHIWEPTPWNKT